MKYYEVEFLFHAPAGLLQDARDLMASGAADAGFESFEETENGMKGYVQQPLFDEEALKMFISMFPIAAVTIEYDVREAEYRNWNEQWEKEGFAPISIGTRCVIHDGRHLPPPRPDGTAPAEIVIEIDSHQAFGTGTHETTRMIITALLDMDMEGKSFLDCGCGTGILSIAALKCGAASATGYDIDEWSTDNARHNAVINSVADRFTSLLGDVSVLGGLHKTFDVVAANINRNILLADMPRICSKMSAKAKLILSGFYRSDAELLCNKANDLGLTLESTTNDSGWCCLIFTA